jgi:hypothetical protein
MPTVPRVSPKADGAPPAAQAPPPRDPPEVKAKRTDALARLLVATRELPAAERVARQMQVLADPAAWDKDAWLD